MPAIETTESNGISTGGHIYSPAQVHEFLRRFGIVVAFLVVSYLALVTIPKLAARRYPSPNANAIAARSVPAPDISRPERPFAPRPPVSLPKTRIPRPPAETRRFHGPACNQPRPAPATGTANTPSPRRRAATEPSPQHCVFPPTVWAAVVHLNFTADSVIGAHPTSLPLRARVAPPHANVQPPAAFLWIEERAGHRFGLVQSTRGHSPTPVRAAAILVETRVKSASLSVQCATPLRGKKLQWRLSHKNFTFSKNPTPVVRTEGKENMRMQA
ncbi:hypothetical protein B0H11DRAFT_1955582 [Mycena galericulata]|nr:hypothetical protein B0H11DRAFT_1955582 [Mycena galericulata]